MKCIDEIIFGIIFGVGLTGLLLHIHDALDCPPSISRYGIIHCVEDWILIDLLSLSVDLSCVIKFFVWLGILFLAIKIEHKRYE